MAQPLGTVAGINRYPLKSAQGESPDSVELTTDGIAHDRTWALRDSETGKLVSAKRPRLWRGLLDCRATGVGDDVEVTLPSGETFGIADPALVVSLSALFGRDVTIEAATAPMQGTYESDWPEIDGLTMAGEFEFPTSLTGIGSTFVDVDPLHLLTTTSMATLAAAAPDAVVDVARFRPSIVIDSAGPPVGSFPENDWEGGRARIGGAVIELGTPAPRCIMTTVAQGELPRQPEILQALAAENRQTNDFGTFACLGSYATVAEPGTIRVGDVVELL